MNRKQKIIILLSLSFLATIFLLSFSRKDSSQKNDDQQLIKKEDNQPLSKPLLSNKKKKFALFWIILTIVIIGIMMIIIFIGQKIIFHYRIKKYLSRKCRFFLFTDGQIKFYLYDETDAFNDLYEMLYVSDIYHVSTNETIDSIYQDLQTAENKKLLKDFGELIGEFFRFLDGHLLCAVYKYQKKYGLGINNFFRTTYDNIKAMLKTCKNDRKILEKDCEIYNSLKFVFGDEKIAIPENENSLNFFKKVMNGNNISYYETPNKEKHLLFENYYAICNLTKGIMISLEGFFQDKRNKDYRDKYEKDYQPIAKKIHDWLTIEQSPDKN